MNVSSALDSALDSALAIIRKDYEEMQDGQEMLKKITEKFSNIAIKPPRDEFELLLGKNFSDDEVLVALFQPLEEQYQYYSSILMNTHNFPATHPLGKVRHLALSLMFLVHRYAYHAPTTYWASIE